MIAPPSPAPRNPTALVAWLNAPAAFGYTPDRLDCVRDALGAAKAQGRPVTLGHRWTTERGARRVLKRLGGLEAAVDRVLPEIPRAHAVRGDIGLVAVGEVQLLVIIEGDTVCGLHPRRGRVRLPRRALTKAWSLG